ncbi:hypothetical protein [Psychromonas sp. L1A2]|nr:hypothetical protein [Psychromonas sp. L1A2]
MSKVTLQGHIIVPDADLAIVKNELQKSTGHPNIINARAKLLTE